MAILYTVDSMTVNKDEFKSIITEMGYNDLDPNNKTWTHIPGEHQFTMVKKIADKDGIQHIFRFTVDT